MVKMEKIIQIKLSEIKDEFYLRFRLNEDHVSYLSSLMDGGTDLGPIRLTEDYIIIDGRHRVEAAKFLDRETIGAIIEKDGNFLNLVQRGLALNIGGALPPSPKDLEYLISGLIDKGFTHAKITEALGNILPNSMLRKIIHHVKWRTNQKRLVQGVSLIIDSRMTLERAAKSVGISPEALKRFLDGKRNKINGEEFTLTKMGLTKRYTKFNKSNGKVITSIFDGFDKGEITRGEMDSLFKHLAKLVTNQNRMYMDWDRRWRAKNVS
jgi:hypothetical protein